MHSDMHSMFKSSTKGKGLIKNILFVLEYCENIEEMSPGHHTHLCDCATTHIYVTVPPHTIM